MPRQTLDMVATTRDRLTRWAAVPVVAAVAVTIGLLAQTRATASGSPRLPARTAAQLLVALQTSTLPAYSGTVKTAVHLGLPSVPDSFAGGGAFSPQSLLTGGQTFRVWVRDQNHQRLAWIGDLSEFDVVHEGSDLWTYDSNKLAVTHATMSKSAHSQQEQQATDEATAPTPLAAANRLLKAIDPSTVVTVSHTARVAGRAAYQLQLTPRDARALVDRVRIAIDGKTSLPLRVEVFSRRSTRAALSVAFTSISFATPRASIFHFTPPKGSKVQPTSLATFVGTHHRHVAGPPDRVRGSTPVAPAPSSEPTMSTPPRTIGSGWTAVEEQSIGSLNPSVSRLLDRISVPVAGGRMISTALLSVLITDDGRLYAGSVDGADLQRVAQTGRAL